MIKIEPTCPLGSKCEEIKNDTIHRCRWYTLVQGMNPQTGEQNDRWDCAIAWLPLLSVELSKTNRGQTAALESFRNEMVDGTDKLIETIATASQNSLSIQQDKKELLINPEQ